VYWLYIPKVSYCNIVCYEMTSFQNMRIQELCKFLLMAILTSLPQQCSAVKFPRSVIRSKEHLHIATHFQSSRLIERSSRSIRKIITFLCSLCISFCDSLSFKLRCSSTDACWHQCLLDENCKAMAIVDEQNDNISRCHFKFLTENLLSKESLARYKENFDVSVDCVHLEKCKTIFSDYI